MTFKEEVTVLSYGLPINYDLFVFDSRYDVEYPVDLNTGVIGEKEYTFIVKDGFFKREVKHTVRVVDDIPPNFELEYLVIITNSNKPEQFHNNIKGKPTDNYDRTVKVETTDVIGDKAGIYVINFVATDEAGNSTTKKATYLYKLTPNNMKKPFYYNYNGADIIICNKLIPLPKSYGSGNDKTAKRQLDKMLEAIRKAGKGSIAIKSAYRSYATQQGLYNRYVAQDGEAQASRYSAKPGHSEHQTGLAFDIGKISESFDKTPAFEWLKEHAHEYGFIMRYPKGKENITGYMYEPWHYRYVGVDLATAIHQSGG